MKTKTAVILAAGTGKRLDAFETPKPLVRVGGKSLIIHTLERIKEAGIKKVYIVVGKNSVLIKRELAGYPLDIEFIEQKRISQNGMLDSILLAGNEIKEPFFVTMCDLIFDTNPYPLFSSNLKKDSISILISLYEKYNSVSGAQTKILQQDEKIISVGISGENNAREVGIYHFTPKSYKEFAIIAKRKDIKTVSHVFNYYNKKKGLNSVILKKGEWFDINTPVTLIKAELFLQKKLSKKDKLQSPKDAKYKKLKVTSGLNYNAQIKFDVIIEKGLVDRFEDYEIIPHKSYYSPHYLIVDKNLDALYGKKIFQKLTSLGYRIHKITVDPGEKSKSIENFIKLANDILDRGIDKKSIIISLGGGVIKDLSGFIASTLYRGIDFISIPTTTLSQCDAAIALKQGVNGATGKNLIGTFYAPKKILVDPEVLSTLDDRYIKDGLAECLKQAFAQDIGFYNFLQKYDGSLNNIDFLEEVIKKSVKLKVSSIQNDFDEEKEALVNQYGHEIGHAVEYLSGYKLAHGESIAIGMRVSAELAHLLGICSEDVLDSHRKLMQKYNLDINIPKYIKPGDIVNTLRYNKKYHGGEPRFVLVKRIGSIWHDKKFYTVSCNDELLTKAIMRSYEYKK